MSEMSGQAQTDMHEEYKAIFGKYAALRIETGSALMPQFRPEYIGMSHCHSLPFAVGTYDVPGQKRWR